MITQTAKKLKTVNETCCPDSGATCHVLSLSSLRNISDSNRTYLQTAATDSEIPIIGVTTISVLEDIAIVNNNHLMDNIVSVAKLVKIGFTITFVDNKAMIINQKGTLLYACICMTQIHTKYQLSIFIWNSEDIIRLTSAKQLIDAKLLHKRLGY